LSAHFTKEEPSLRRLGQESANDDGSVELLPSLLQRPLPGFVDPPVCANLPNMKQSMKLDKQSPKEI
jgi:hypothetical protein